MSLSVCSAPGCACTAHTHPARGYTRSTHPPAPDARGLAGPPSCSSRGGARKAPGPSVTPCPIGPRSTCTLRGRDLLGRPGGLRVAGRGLGGRCLRAHLAGESEAGTKPEAGPSPLLLVDVHSSSGPRAGTGLCPSLCRHPCLTRCPSPSCPLPQVLRRALLPEALPQPLFPFSSRKSGLRNRSLTFQSI